MKEKAEVSREMTVSKTIAAVVETSIWLRRSTGLRSTPLILSTAFPSLEST